MKIDFNSFFQKIDAACLPSDIKLSLVQFYKSYEQVVASLGDSCPESLYTTLSTYIKLIEEEVTSPTLFQHFHVKETAPFDYFQFGLDMVSCLIDEKKSCVLGKENLLECHKARELGDNILFLSNHQAEIDPQIISILTNSLSQDISKDIVCVAGHRVTQDPLAIPFSRGRNLICIYSKKYIDHPPEKKEEKLLHNARAMSAIEALLEKGGTSLYVAPSGGRDRILPDGTLVPAAFDPQSVEMFRLLAMSVFRKTSKKTHIHLLALHTIDQLPPPKGININLGEERIAKRAPAGLYFSPPINMEELDIKAEEELAKRQSQEPLASSQLKQEKRLIRAACLHKELVQMYQTLKENLI